MKPGPPTAQTPARRTRGVDQLPCGAVAPIVRLGSPRSMEHIRSNIKETPELVTL